MLRQSIRVIILLNFFLVASNQRTILFIDTLNTPSYLYQDLLDALKEQSHPIHYIAWHDQQRFKLINQADAVFINCGGWVLCNPSANKAIFELHSLLEQLRTFKGTLSFFLPEIRSEATQRVFIQTLLANSCLESEWKKNNHQAINTAVKFLLQSDALYSAAYPTTLLGIRPEVQKPTLPTLPLGLTWLPAEPHNAPLGLALDDGKNKLIFLKSSRITAFGIAENFLYTPCTPSLFNLYKTDIARTIHQLFSSGLNQSRTQQIAASTTPKKYPVLPFHQWLNRQGPWCGWADIEPFFDNELGWIRSLKKMGLNHMWFELNPEWYLSDNGLRKEHKEKFLQRIAQWTASLRRWQSKGNSPLRLFIGTDLTSNFAQSPVKDAAIDLCGTIYDKIPAPLSFETFWQPEFITVFNRLMKEWPTIGNGIQISGIFLDLEMYHAQNQASQYTSTMDFSQTAWNLWLKRRPYCAQPQVDNPQDRISYLAEHTLLSEYYQVLQQEACILGRKIREYVRSIIPGGLIGVYAINLPHSWFYLGFLAGLSTPTSPIILATFNHRFDQHQKWLEKQKIYAYHMSPYLLSKLQNKSDAALISDLAQVNHGVWFNKISRIAQSREKKDWAWDFGMEVTPLETSVATQLISNEIEQAQDACKSTP